MPSLSLPSLCDGSISDDIKVAWTGLGYMALMRKQASKKKLGFQIVLWGSVSGAALHNGGFWNLCTQKRNLIIWKPKYFRIWKKLSLSRCETRSLQYMAQLLTSANSVFWRTRFRIHRDVAASCLRRFSIDVSIIHLHLRHRHILVTLLSYSYNSSMTLTQMNESYKSRIIWVKIPEILKWEKGGNVAGDLPT